MNSTNNSDRRKDSDRDNYPPLPLTSFKSPTFHKKNIVFIFLFLILLTLPIFLGWYVQNQKNQTKSEAATSGGRVLTNNPNFENGMLNWSILQKAGSSSVVEVVGENVGLNQHSFKISNTQSGKTIVYQDRPVDAKARYTIRANGVVSMSGGNASIRVQEYDLVRNKKVFNDDLDTERVLLSNNTPHTIGTMVKTHGQKTALAGPNLALVKEVQAVDPSVTPTPTTIPAGDIHCGTVCYRPGGIPPDANTCSPDYTCAPADDKGVRHCWSTSKTPEKKLCTGGDGRGDNDPWVKPLTCGKNCFNPDANPTNTPQQITDACKTTKDGKDIYFSCAPPSDLKGNRYCWTNPNELPQAACSQSDLNGGQNPTKTSTKFLRISLIVDGVGTAYFDRVLLEPDNTHHRVSISAFDPPVLPATLSLGKTYKFKFNINDQDSDDIMLPGVGKPPCRFNEPTCDYGDDIPVPDTVRIYKDSGNPRIGWLEFTPQAVGDNQRIRMWVYDGFMPAVRTLKFNVIEFPPKKIFTTKATYDGNLGGITGADSICQTTASQAGLNGVYKVWLGDDTHNPLNYMPHNEGKYTLVDGTVIANDWQDLTDNSILASVNKDERGNLIADASNLAWTGTPIIGDTRPDKNCNNWTSRDQYQGIQGRVGMISAKNNIWFHGSAYACGYKEHLYCFEQ